MTNTMMQNVARAATTGAVAAGITAATRGTTANLNLALLGTRVPLYAGVGLGVAAGSLAAAYVHDLVFPAIHVTEKYEETATAVVNLGSVAAGSYVALYGMHPRAVSEFGLMMLFSTAAAAEIGGSYAYTHFIGPMIKTNE